ncbi:hypothetical protein Tco_0851647 [Tanacetum coccineum]
MMNLEDAKKFSSNNFKSFSVFPIRRIAYKRLWTGFRVFWSQLEIHGAGVSTEDANQKFLRLNNLRVFESDIKGSTASSSSTQNVAFVSSESTNSTNDVSTAYGVSTSSGHNSQKEGSSSYTDELKYSFFANQSSGPQLDHEDLEQVDEFDLEEMDLKWQVAMISMRLKKFYKKTGRRLQFDAKEPVGFDKTKKGVDLDSGHTRGEQKNYALMAYNNFRLTITEMSTRDNLGLGSSDVEDSHVYDRFAKVEGMHVVPLQLIFVSCESNSSVETLESVPKPAINEPKAVSKPKVWSDAPIIVEYESDADDEYVIKPSKEQEKSSFAFVNTVKHVKSPREIVKEQNTCSLSPKADKRDWNGLMSKKLGLGYGFTKKACFVCGSFSHLIRDCDFHKKRIAKQVELNKEKGKGTGQGENRPVWNNVQRLNHQNKFVPKVVLTKTGIFLVNAARQNLSS